MIETRLDQMLTMLRNREILGDTAFANVDLQDALDIRSSDESYRHFYLNELDSRWRILPIHTDLRGIFKDLHAETYARAKQQIMATISHAGDRDYQTLAEVLSCRIQQEIGQIAKSRATEYGTPWHDALWESYLQNEIPMITAEPIIRPIREKQRAG